MKFGANNIKKYIIMFFIVIISFSGFSQSFLFNGKSIELENVIEKSGKKFFKIREVIEKNGGTVKYDESSIVKIIMSDVNVWLFPKEFKYVYKSTKKEDTITLDKESLLNQGGSWYIEQSALQNMLILKIEDKLAKLEDKVNQDNKNTDKTSTDKNVEKTLNKIIDKNTKDNKDTKANIQPVKEDKTEIKTVTKDENQMFRDTTKITSKKSLEKVEKVIDNKEEKNTALVFTKQEPIKLPVKEEKSQVNTVEKKTEIPKTEGNKTDLFDDDKILEARAFTKDDKNSVVVLEFNDIKDIKIPQLKTGENTLYLFKIDNAKTADDFNFSDKSEMIKKVECFELGDGVWVKIELENEAMITKDISGNRVLLNFKFNENSNMAKKNLAVDSIFSNLKTTNKGYILPIYGIITSEFGWRIHPIFKVTRYHDGIDISAPIGTPIKSSTDGEVIDAYYHKSYGKMVRVKTSDNVIVLYAHMDTIKVSQGDKLIQGDIVGTVGNTGISTGPHLHLQIEDTAGKIYNPREYCSELGQLKVSIY